MVRTSKTTAPPPPQARGTHVRRTREAPALIVAWSVLEPGRTGEVLLLDGSRDATFGLGRFDPDYDYGDLGPLRPLRQRPGRNESCAPLALPSFVSRRQLALSPRADGSIEITNVGREGATVQCPHPLAPGRSTVVDPGQAIDVASHLVLYCATRPVELAPLRYYPEEACPGFGEPDEHGVVGESPEAWALRDRLAFVARTSQHVLLSGPSGSGKELAAAAIHRMSPRRERALVAHSAADIPATLMEAELFGNRANYPNAGLPEREGLIGQADGATLFIDELGLLPHELQAKLLRVLDEGSYRRLGLDQPLRADLRLIAATNQSIDAIKDDLRARLQIVLELPGLNERPDDILLIALHLLRKLAERQPDAGIVRRFVDDERGERATFRLSTDLVQALVRHRFTLNVRELQQLLLLSVYHSPGETLELAPELEARLGIDDDGGEAPVDVPCKTVEQILEDYAWNVSAAARALGWSRSQLNRKIQKCGLVRPEV